jgi:hypothetical protein
MALNEVVIVWYNTDIQFIRDVGELGSKVAISQV